MPNPHKTWWEWSTNEVIIFSTFHKNWAKSVDFFIQWAKIKSAAFIWEIGFRTIPKWYYLLQPRNITKVQFRSTAFIRRIKDSLKKYWLLFEKRNLFGFLAHNRAKLYVMAKVIIHGTKNRTFCTKKYWNEIHFSSSGTDGNFRLKSRNR